MGNNQTYLSHILEAIEFIFRYTQNHNFEYFCHDDLTVEAVCRKIEIIGEAASRITSSFKQQHPDIPWRLISDTRNKLIHDYDDIDLKYIWEIINQDLPKLKTQIELISPL